MSDTEQLKMRLAAIGKDRKWLVEITGYTYSSIMHGMAENSPNKSAKILRAIDDAISNEEKAQGRKNLETKGLFTLEFTPNEFAQVDAASRMVNALSLKDFCQDAVMIRTRELLQKRSTLAIHTHQSHELPLLRAAAGSPIIADAEMVEVDHDYGQGRFILELRGDSMEPQFRDRQRVILRDIATLKRPVLKYGELYCFVHNGQACFKQWAKGKVLHSFNVEYEDIPADEETSWIGWYDPADNQ